MQESPFYEQVLKRGITQGIEQGDEQGYERGITQGMNKVNSAPNKMMLSNC